MYFRQFYDTPLAQASYLIGCQATGEAILVDPLRDLEPYLAAARTEGLRITHVTETHIHADFASGLREAVSQTGAHAYLSAEGGTDWQYRFAEDIGATMLHDGDRIMVGNVALDVMHTPGHTPEHLCFIVTDTPAGAGPLGIITGDFVFVGDVGRPDLLEKAAKVANTMEAGARTLFASLSKFRALPDHLQVWPGHGAGSACGKALGAVPFSTVGYEKIANWGVAQTNESAFVQEVLAGQPEPPGYFAHMKRINRDGVPLLGERSFTRVHADRLVELLGETAPARNAKASVILDIRPGDQFAEGHIPDAIGIPYNKSFVTYAGSVLPFGSTIYLLVGDDLTDVSANETPGGVARAARDLASIGYDAVAGYMGIDALRELERRGVKLATIRSMSVDELAQDISTGDSVRLIDVRNASEWDAGHIAGAQHVPLSRLDEELANASGVLRGAGTTRPVYVQCQSGARSMIAASVLQRAGWRNVTNVRGGFAAWERSGKAVERTPASTPGPTS